MNDLQKSILMAADHIARKNPKMTALFAVQTSPVEQINTVGEAMKHLEKIKDYLQLIIDRNAKKTFNYRSLAWWEEEFYSEGIN
ncbi:MAG: hypothetical protein KDC85_21490 [Saprospiraceae bacterium]|nr:hypothetical protein [Saprospiraceae bacterium]MCB9324344.1 hypothetical protein [Lewinellaceae bacterium]